MSRALDVVKDQRDIATASIPQLQADVAAAEVALARRQALLDDALAMAKDCDEAVTVLDEMVKADAVRTK